MIAVTGFNGYLGQYLFKKKKICELKRNFFNKKIYLENPEYFIHLAALNVFECNKNLEKSKKINTDYAVKSLNFAIKKNFKNFIFFSSTQLYGNYLKGLVTEKTKPRPVSNYSISKFNAEKKLKKMAKGKINLIIFRISNVINPYYKIKTKNYLPFVTDVVNQSMSGKIYISNNILQYRDFICIKYVKKILFKTIGVFKKKNKKSYFLFNVTSGYTYTLSFIVNEINNIIYKKFKKKIIIIQKKNAKKIKKFNLSNKKILNFLKLKKQPKKFLLQSLTKLVFNYYICK